MLEARVNSDGAFDDPEEQETYVEEMVEAYLSIGSVDQALEFIATEQKRLVDIAKALFDAPSAAKLVRSLVPPLMSEPFSQLNEQIAAAGVDALLETSADDSEVSEDDD